MPYSSAQSNGHYVPTFCQYLVREAPSRSGRGTTVASKQYFFFGSALLYVSHKRHSIKSNATSCSLTNGWEKEEACWLREEKRWLREEERWLRAEERWNNERKALMEQGALFQAEINTLKEEIAQLEKQLMDGKPKDLAVSELAVNVANLLQSMNIASSERREGFKSSTASISIPSSASASANRPEFLVEVTEQASKGSTTSSKRSIKEKRTLKRGAEGDDVKVLQEALAKLGFYSGEEDMEDSVFSSGTERAVRTWQASIGTSEDGILTSELLIKLLGEDTSGFSQQETSAKEKSKIAAPAASVKGSTTPPLKPQAPSLKTTSSTYVGASDRRVYLLGENRWEEPERLLSKNGPILGVAVSGVKCFSCKGQGKMMCTECEGTGELNVEEQFLEWAEEDANCPYCEGKGGVDCDVCDGKGVTMHA